MVLIKKPFKNNKILRNLSELCKILYVIDGRCTSLSYVQQEVNEIGYYTLLYASSV